MVVQSGVVPYEYSVGLPFRTPSSLGENAIGISGIHLEQAAYVLTAERRKWQSDKGVLDDIFLYTNPIIAPSGPFEPKANGSTLANQLNPGSIALDNILELRYSLDQLMSNYSVDTDYLARQHFTDWIRQAYPYSPSGRFDLVFWGDPTNANEADADYLRPSGNFGTGEFTDLDLHWLGGSGVIFDIDAGEVMFQPYPFLRQTNFGDAYGDGESFNVQVSPFYPAFQKTNGDLISSNGRETPSVLFRLKENPDGSSYHIASGYIRVDGYILTPNTDFLLGQLINENSFFSNASDFNYVTGHPRQIGTSVLSTIVDETARAFVTPTSQTSGVYRAAVRLPKSTSDFVAVESGIISTWPRPDRAFGEGGSAGGNRNIGYHVFDDCIWLNARGGNGTNFVGTNPSGLAIVSPWTGHLLWVHQVELTKSTGAQDDPVAAGDQSQDPSSWGEHVGLERPSTNSIVRIQKTADFTTDYMTDSIIRFQRYNDDLDYTTETNTSFALDVNAQSIFTDLFFDGTNYWAFINLAGTPSRVARFNSSFAFVDLFEYAFPVATNRFSRGAYINSTRVGYEFNTLNIFPFTFSTASSPGTITKGAVKPIDASFIDTSPATSGIHDIVQVTGSTHLDDGVWALIGIGGTIITPQGLHLVRIVEDASTWRVVGHYDLERNGNFSVALNAEIDILYMPIP